MRGRLYDEIVLSQEDPRWQTSTGPPHWRDAAAISAVGRVHLLGISEPGLCHSHTPLPDTLLLRRVNRRGQLLAVDAHQVGDVEYGLERLLRHLPLRLSVTRGDGDLVAAHGRLEAVLALLLGRVEESLGTIEKRAGRDGHKRKDKASALDRTEVLPICIQRLKHMKTTFQSLLTILATTIDQTTMFFRQLIKYSVHHNFKKRWILKDIEVVANCNLFDSYICRRKELKMENERYGMDVQRVS